MDVSLTSPAFQLFYFVANVGRRKSTMGMRNPTDEAPCSSRSRSKRYIGPLENYSRGSGGWG